MFNERFEIRWKLLILANYFVRKVLYQAFDTVFYHQMKHASRSSSKILRCVSYFQFSFLTACFSCLIYYLKAPSPRPLFLSSPIFSTLSPNGEPVCYRLGRTKNSTCALWKSLCLSRCIEISGWLVFKDFMSRHIFIHQVISFFISVFHWSMKKDVF